MFKTFAGLKEYAATGEQFRQLTPEDFKKLHNVLLEILCDFHNICEDNHLTYFLTGGSALGAKRDQGFIPWDDDIDVIMPREDYERLAQAVSCQYADKYWVQNLQSSTRYDLNFSKLRKLGTEFLELYETDPDQAGICLDVYPLDDTHTNAIARLFYGIADEMLFLISSCVRMYQKKDKLLEYIKDKKLVRMIKVKSMIGRLFSNRKNPRNWYFRCESWCKSVKNKESKYVTVSCGRGHFFGEMYERDKLFPPVLTEFEGKQVYVARDNDYLLNVLYGPEYMTPPAVGRRESHALLALAFEKEKEV